MTATNGIPCNEEHVTRGACLFRYGHSCSHVYEGGRPLPRADEYDPWRFDVWLDHFGASLQLGPLSLIAFRARPGARWIFEAHWRNRILVLRGNYGDRHSNSR